jgi:hypothetical protein
MILDGASDKLQVVTSSTADLHSFASYVDKNALTITPSRKATAIVTATTTDVVLAPGATIQRHVKKLTLRNKHASTANTVTLQYFDGATAFEIFKATLAAGEVIQYTEAGGFVVFDATGAIKNMQTAAGRLLGVTVLTAGTTFTTGANTTKILVRMVGGGGGGGGCTSVASSASAAGGGGAGGYAEKVFAVSPNTGYTYAIGALGAGVSGAAGANGGDTTFTVGATTVTAKGGTGAPLLASTTTLTARAGGAGGVVSTNGDLNGAGAPGEPGNVLIVATPIVSSGDGGSGPYGGGGLGLVAAANGNNAAGFGAGGGGSATGASAVRTGGSGTAGVIIVEEYA